MNNTNHYLAMLSLDAGQCDCGGACALAAEAVTDISLQGIAAWSNWQEMPRILSAWLHITDSCNLDCAYCYLPHRPIDMPLDIAIASIDAVFRSAQSHGYEMVKLKYAGGEPLLRFSTIVQAHRYALKVAAVHQIELLGLVLSNGTLLTLDTIKTLLELDLKLAISLDGLGEYHDLQRRYASGEGSFNQVATAIELALSAGLTPYISVTVSARNAPGLPALVRWMLDRNLPFGFNFYRENERSAAYPDLRLEEEQIIQAMLAAYKVIEQDLPNRNLLASLADRANLAVPHLRTCGVGHSYLVFDPLGRVAKCQMDMAYTVTDFKAQDPLQIVREDKGGIQGVPVTENPHCSECQWKYFCGGGCPLMNYRATGRYDGKSPNCNIYRALFPELVKLEKLRLRKYGVEKAQGLDGKVMETQQQQG